MSLRVSTSDLPTAALTDAEANARRDQVDETSHAGSTGQWAAR